MCPAEMVSFTSSFVLFVTRLLLSKFWRKVNFEKIFNKIKAIIIFRNLIRFFLFFWECGSFILSSWSWSLYENCPQSPPSFFQNYSIFNNASLISTRVLLPCFDPNEWSMKNGLHSGGLSPQPLSHESSALTTPHHSYSPQIWFC